MKFVYVDKIVYHTYFMYYKVSVASVTFAS